MRWSITMVSKVNCDGWGRKKSFDLQIDPTDFIFSFFFVMPLDILWLDAKFIILSSFSDPSAIASASTCGANGQRMRMNSGCLLFIMLGVSLSRIPRASASAFSKRSFTAPRHHLKNLATFALQFATSTENSENTPLSMTNLYQEWTLEQDRLLHEKRNEPLPVLASLLGRGLRGVESRLAKLSDVDSPAYQRLFCDSEAIPRQDASKKLVPAGEVLRRIQYDYNLAEKDFSVVHYDRVDDNLVETPMDAPNTSVAGREERFVFAIPEHRIMKIKYKEQIVWDREGRLDRVFGSMNGNGETIDQLIDAYDEWKRKRDEEIEVIRQRQKEVSFRIQQILGLSRYDLLKELSSNLLHENEDAASIEQKDVSTYVKSCLQLFREVRNDPNSSIEPSWIPMTDVDALDTFSELAALLSNQLLRSAILVEIDSYSPKQQQGPSLKKYVLPELREEDLTETFVRGSGAGGQVRTSGIALCFLFAQMGCKFVF